MSKTKATPSERLDKAIKNENAKAGALAQAANEWANYNGNDRGPWDRLTEAAKAWTNAYHERSRREKHVRDSKNGGQS